MAEVHLTPEAFVNVFFDPDEIRRIASGLLDQLGLDVDLHLEIDESTPLGRLQVTSLDPVTIAVESGAFEDKKRPRQLGPVETTDNLGRLLVKVADRLDPDFGTPPAISEELPLPLYVAWDTYAMGRLARLGHPPQRQRRLYAFQLRHGFTDVADAVFERLWTAEALTWDEIVAASDEARAAVAA